ncbi:m-AAA protease-interacting protein 1, mitochondrial [Pseudolycoriella hygida]|uniref:M-AAA protease-interacting protein 1, mitochondrial n=1 Tax=Pseudolycoriella hygida TaxID=35572 RepID=A0A9Q0S537_9DIPT|nr:m-AAA protease-interacting protein 1, mitochondrial [Pseudolycoriella hygida]
MMALPVLQKIIQKCSLLNTRTALSRSQNKFSNETKSASKILTNKFRNLYRLHSSSYLTQSNVSQTKQLNKHLILQSTQRCDVFGSVTYRTYTTEDNQRSKESPPLMKFPKITRPSVRYTIRNWHVVNSFIRPCIDSDFTLANFTEGSKHAVQVMSWAMASGELNILDGFVSSRAFYEIKKNLSVMSRSQRDQIAVLKDDIYFCFPYLVSVFSDKRFHERVVEITMVFHVLRGLQEMRKRDSYPLPLPMLIGMLPEYRGNVFICNYRFYKVYTRGRESNWIINVANHFKRVD